MQFFGFAMTLLVVSLDVPNDFGELLDVLRGTLAFAVSFTMLIWVWYKHYQFYRNYGLQDGVTITLNAVLLFLVLLYVYPLKFLSSWLMASIFPFFQPDDKARVIVINLQETPALMAIYGIGFAAVLLVFVLMHWHAYRQQAALELNPYEMFETMSSIQAGLLQAGIGLVSVATAILGGTDYASLAGLEYMAIFPLMVAFSKMRARQWTAQETQAHK